MTNKEILQALRCSATKEEQKSCDMSQRSKRGCFECINSYLYEAASLIEQMTAENAALREKQAETEAERDALLGELRKSGCTYCKYETVCEVNPWLLSQKVCDHCDKRESCVCLTCTGDGSETDKWKWRGLPETPKDGESNA